MNPIRTNKPVFFGDNGEVLKSGYIYIGQPNQDPIQFPKTVTFQDSAGAQFTASQPLRTNGDGQICQSGNGKAFIALVDGNYSMLIQNQAQVQIKSGWIPFVENTDGGGSITGATQVGTLLSDIKQLNVTPGDTVRNVGKITALDGEGADWLVVSNTGVAGDDVELIDFDNGTQGRLTKQATISISDYMEETVELGGDFAAGQSIQILKIGNLVTIRGASGALVYTAPISVANASPGVIPVWARPSSGGRGTIYAQRPGTSVLFSVNVFSTGQFNITHRLSDTGAASIEPDSLQSPLITYSI